MNDLQLFNYEGKAVRTVTIEGEPWWVAKDIAELLGYSWKGSQTIDHVPEEWRGVYSVVTPSGLQDMVCLSEQGLYFFLNRSDKEKAIPFQKWISGTVLPSIRKTGQYSIPKTDEEIILIGYEKLMNKVKQLTPKADAYEQFLESDGVKNMAIVAQELFGDKMGRNTLMKKLREMGILKPDNTPHQEYMKYFKLIPIPKTVAGKIIYFDTTHVKPVGIDYLAKKFNIIKPPDSIRN